MAVNLHLQSMAGCIAAKPGLVHHAVIWHSAHLFYRDHLASQITVVFSSHVGLLRHAMAACETGAVHNGTDSVCSAVISKTTQDSYSNCQLPHSVGPQDVDNIVSITSC